MASIENISPAVIKRISRELQKLQQQPPEGIKLIVNEDNITDVQAWIMGPEGTPYEGGNFRIKIVLGADFPNAPPKCYFITKLFHPNVSATGEVCVNTLKKDWKKELGIAHILLTVKCLLIYPNPESALNEEAGRLLLEQYEDYAKHARLMTSIHAAGQKVDFGGAGAKKVEAEVNGGLCVVEKVVVTEVSSKRVVDKKSKVTDKKKTLRRL
ncbi:uncharacterized protein VTP21DRAFT_83 [Calcarisporiella thermophila]|uniref:uncharacterized protein n=1 Tax=Calcarisporiella thermophila TaxID=911321 RepID=UPI003742112F